MTEEQWIAIWRQAGAKKGIAGQVNSPDGIKGRSISYLAKKLVDFWKKHQATLAPWLQQISIAALDAVEVAILDILSVNGPGPE